MEENGGDAASVKPLTSPRVAAAVAADGGGGGGGGCLTSPPSLEKAAARLSCAAVSVHSESLLQAVRKRTTFFRLHLLYFVTLCLLGTLALWLIPKNPENMPNQQTQMPFIDALFFATSAVCVTGLGTLDMSVMTAADLVVLMILAAVGGAVFTSLGPVLVRRYYFRQKLRQTEETERSRDTEPPADRCYHYNHQQEQHDNRERQQHGEQEQQLDQEREQGRRQQEQEQRQQKQTPFNAIAGKVEAGGKAAEQSRGYIGVASSPSQQEGGERGGASVTLSAPRSDCHADLEGGGYGGGETGRGGERGVGARGEGGGVSADGEGAGVVVVVTVAVGQGGDGQEDSPVRDDSQLPTESLMRGGGGGGRGGEGKELSMTMGVPAVAGGLAGFDPRESREGSPSPVMEATAGAGRASPGIPVGQVSPHSKYPLGEHEENRSSPAKSPMKSDSDAWMRRGQLAGDHAFTWAAGLPAEEAMKMVRGAPLTRRVARGRVGRGGWFDGALARVAAPEAGAAALGGGGRGRGGEGGGGRGGTPRAARAGEVTGGEVGACSVSSRSINHPEDCQNPKSLLAMSDTTSSKEKDIDNDDENTECYIVDLHKVRSVEHLALVELSKLVPLYYFFSVFVGSVLVTILLSSSPENRIIVSGTKKNVYFFALFHCVSGFNNAGFSILPANLIPLRKSTGVLLVVAVLILLGNTLYAPAMRGIIVLLHRYSKSKKRVYEYLLDHPRKCFTHLFPGPQTKWLVIAIIVTNVVESVAFLVLDWNSAQFSDLSSAHVVVNGVFQAVSTRHAGFQVVLIPLLKPAMAVLYCGLMYTAVYPVFLTRTHSELPREAYDHADIGVQKIDWESAVVANSMKWQAAGLLGHDACLLFISLFLICVREEEKIMKDGNFAVMNIIFEVISGFGNVGLSTGICIRQDPADPESFCSPQSPNYSLSGEFHVASKLVMVFVMFLGRHRGLPHNIDSAIRIPKKALFRRRASTIPIDLSDPTAVMESVRRERLLTTVLTDTTLSPELRVRLMNNLRRQLRGSNRGRVSLREVVQEIQGEVSTAGAQGTGGTEKGGGRGEKIDLEQAEVSNYKRA